MVDIEAIDATDLIVCVRDRTGRYVLVSRGFEALTRLPRERIQGKRDAALNPKDIAERVAFHDAQVFDTGAPSEVDEELLGHDGRLPVRSCRFAICNDDGEPWAVCSVSAERGAAEHVRAERDRLAAIAAGTPKPHSAVTSERLETLVADLATTRETADALTEALEAERSAREEQAAAHEALTARVEKEVKRHAETRSLLERERGATEKLGKQVKELEIAAKKANEGGLLHSVRLRHERAEKAKVEARVQAEETARRALEQRLERERSDRERLTAELQEARRNLERTGRELEAARSALEEAQATAAAVEAEAHARAEAVAVAEAQARAAAVAEALAAAAAAAEAAAQEPESDLVVVETRVTDLIADASSLESAMRAGLAAFGELAGWDSAVGWLVHRDGASLRPASVWCSQAVAGSTFDTQSWQAVLDDGPAAIAAAWEAREHAWIEDAGADEDRPRCRWAKAAGLTTAAAVPVLVDDQLRGLIEVYRRDRTPRDENVLTLLETVARQLGGHERQLELAGRPRWR